MTFSRVVQRLAAEGASAIVVPTNTSSFGPRAATAEQQLHRSNNHRRATAQELDHYLGRIAPELPTEQAAKELWRDVDVFGEDGSRKKELGIERAILEEPRADAATPR